MRKILNYFRFGIAAALCLGVAGTANATIIEGEYEFSSTFQLENPSYSDQFSADCTFTISKNANGSTVIIKGFLVEDFDQSQYTGTGTESGIQEVELDAQIIFMGEFYFANENGDYPVTYYDNVAEAPVFCDYYLTWTFDENGNITMPNFTVVTLNEDNHTTNIVARYSNCKVVDPNKVLPKLDQLAGDYTFTSTLTDVTEGFDYFSANFDFKGEYFPSANNIQLQGFIIEDYEEFIAGYDEETGIITFNQWISFYDPELMFANANGDYPGWHYDLDLDEAVEDWYLTAQIDSKGNITFPEFTIVNVIDSFDATCEIVARFSNATARKTDGFQESVTVDIPGSYTVTGTKLDYTANASNPTSTTDTFTLTIGEFGELMAIAGYTQDDLDVFYEEGYDTGYIESTYWGLPCYNNKGPAYLEKAGTNGKTRTVVLSGASTESYQNSAEITLSYTDGEWNLTDFTIWSQTTQNVPGDDETPDKTETVSTLLYAWQNMTVTKGEEGGDEPGGEEPGDDDDFVGDHVFNWYKTDYSDPANPVTTREEMTLSINNSYQYTAIGGYTVSPDFIEYGYNVGEVDGNVWSIELNNFSNVINLDMATGAGLFVSGPSTTGEAPNNEAILTLTYEDGNYTLSDFTIWQKAISTSSGDTDEEGNVGGETSTSWRLLYKWSSEGEVTEIPEEPNPLVGTHLLVGTMYNYTGRASEPIVSTNYSFNLTIDENGCVTSLAGYDTAGIVEYGYNQGEFGDDNWTIDTQFFYTEFIGVNNATEFMVVGTGNTNAYTDGTLTFDGETFSDFTLWTRANGAATPVLLFAFTDLSTKDIVTGVENVEINSNAPVEFYNLQGVRVMNPENGIYIMRQGNKSQKVIIK